MSIQTSQLSAGASAVRRHPVVRSARLAGEERDGSVLEVALVPGVDRIPPGVLRLLAEHDCGISALHTDGQYQIVEVR